LLFSAPGGVSSGGPFRDTLSPNELGLVVSGVWQTWSVALVSTGLLCANQWAGVRKWPASSQPTRISVSVHAKNHAATPSEAFAFVALACTAGLSEEFVYRGFVFAVFSRAFTGTPFAGFFAAVMSSAWFAMAHLYQGRRGVL